MEKQIVVFELGKELFGIEITAVEGIVKMQEITKIPYAPDFVEGITELRGSVLPVMDLNKRFLLPPQERTNETRIITVILGTTKMGMIVSAVAAVVTIDDSVIEPPPPIFKSINTNFITGIAKLNDRLVILLDLQQVLNASEQTEVEKILTEIK
jgi:purine-binding chemotaxis protein CheW